MRLGVLRVFVLFYVLVFYGPFCHGALKLDISQHVYNILFLNNSLIYIDKEQHGWRLALMVLQDHIPRSGGKMQQFHLIDILIYYISLPKRNFLPTLRKEGTDKEDNDILSVR